MVRLTRRKHKFTHTLYDDRFYTGTRFTNGVHVYTITLYISLGMRAVNMRIAGYRFKPMIYTFVKKNMLEHVKTILDLEDISKRVPSITTEIRSSEMLMLFIESSQIHKTDALLVAAECDFDNVIRTLLRMYTFDTKYIKQVARQTGQHGYNKSIQLLRDQYWKQVNIEFALKRTNEKIK